MNRKIIIDINETSLKKDDEVIILGCKKDSRYVSGICIKVLKENDVFEIDSRLIK